MEFGNGVGIGLNSTVLPGHVLIEIPEEFAFTGDYWEYLWSGESFTIEPLVASLAVKFWITNDTLCDILRPLLPSSEWLESHGLFNLQEEFPLLTTGTSMATWLDVGVNITNDVFQRLSGTYPDQLSLDHIRWAYMVAMS